MFSCTLICFNLLIPFKNYLHLSCLPCLRLRFLMYKQQTTPCTAHDCRENQIRAFSWKTGEAWHLPVARFLAKWVSQRISGQLHTTTQWPTTLTDILESRHETVVGRSASFKTTPERWSVLAEKRSGCHCLPRKHLPTLNTGYPEVFSVTTSRSLDVKAVPCMALPAPRWLPPNAKDAQEISIQFTSVDNFLSLGKSLSQALLLAVIYPFLTWRKNHPIW